MKCIWHLCKNELIGNKKKKFCGSQCKSKFYVTKYRRRAKISAVEYKGGKCARCGYNECIDALEFHHVDASKKEFSIADSGNTKSWDKMKVELDKCDLLCSNCHRKAHSVNDEVVGLP